MTIVIFILGFLFGAILRYAKVNRFNTISGQAMLRDHTVAKMILVAVGAGIIMVNLEIQMGFASYHIKPFLLGGVVTGGVIFGIGMAILGYCPGTMAVSLGEGSLDALAGIVGGLLGGYLFTLAQPSLQWLMAPDLGKVSLHSLTGDGFLFSFLIVIIGTAFIKFAFYLNKMENASGKKWLIAGIALAVLQVIVFHKDVTDRVIGASTTYPYLGDSLVGNTDNSYFQKIKVSGHWELIFLSGAFVAGLIFSLITKEFKAVVLHENWKKYRKASIPNRVFWALAGGFILIFGARIAGGCTSGHVISGSMQLAFSSLTFGIFMFASLVATGRVFYKT